MHDLATLSDLSDGLAVKANALGGVDEVRRGEEPGAQPAAPQYGLEEGAGRALALGTYKTYFGHKFMTKSH